MRLLGDPDENIEVTNQKPKVVDSYQVLADKSLKPTDKVGNASRP
ncbi:hypothetical protein [Halobacillus faecis]|nr:hypothetical protein [Halobacillus faecis]